MRILRKQLSKTKNTSSKRFSSQIFCLPLPCIDEFACFDFAAPRQVIFLIWPNHRQLFVAHEFKEWVKLKCCGIWNFKTSSLWTLLWFFSCLQCWELSMWVHVMAVWHSVPFQALDWPSSCWVSAWNQAILLPTLFTSSLQLSPVPASCSRWRYGLAHPTGGEAATKTSSTCHLLGTIVYLLPHRAGGNGARGLYSHAHHLWHCPEERNSPRTPLRGGICRLAGGHYPSDIATVNFDRSGTTVIGKYLLNHSFMMPGLVSVSVSTVVGLIITHFIY